MEMRREADPEEEHFGFLCKDRNDVILGRRISELFFMYSYNIRGDEAKQCSGHAWQRAPSCQPSVCENLPHFSPPGYLLSCF